MKSILSIIITFLLASSVTSSAKIIRNPYFEARKSSVVTIEEIDRSKDATRVKFHAVFRPKWWISFDESESLFDPATGQSYAPLSGEGITLGEKCWMPESGDTTFTVIYPPLPKNVKTIDFAPASGWATFGIDLTGKKKIASHVDDLTLSPRKPLPSFFTPGNVRIHGHIKGYDDRLDLYDIKAYIADLPVGERQTRLIELDDEGNFDTELYITSPQVSYISIFNGCYMNLYLEPDNDIQIIIDWEDILAIDRMRGLKYRMDNIKFGGSLGEINHDIYFAPKPDLQVPTYNMADNTTPLDAKEIISSAASGWIRDTEAYADENNLSPDSRRLLDNLLLAKETMDMLDYEMYRRDKRWEFPDSDEFNQPFPREFYAGFLPRFLNADTSVLAATDMVFVLNRIGFCNIGPTLGVDDNRYSKEYEPNLSRALCEFAGVDSVPFMWQMAVAAREGNGITGSARWDKEHFRQFLDQTFAATISDPYLRGRLDSLYFNVVNFQPYDLPDTEGGRLMRQLVAPYAGKWLLVDFWATSCGPCRANIEHMKPFRDANRNNEYFDFLFITGEDESPADVYTSFVNENLTGDHVLRLPQSDHNRLRALFGIDGIPRYVLIDPLGRVFDPDISNSNFTQHLRQEKIYYIIPEKWSLH